MQNPNMSNTNRARNLCLCNVGVRTAEQHASPPFWQPPLKHLGDIMSHADCGVEFAIWAVRYGGLPSLFQPRNSCAQGVTFFLVL